MVDSGMRRGDRPGVSNIYIRLPPLITTISWQISSEHILSQGGGGGVQCTDGVQSDCTGCVGITTLQLSLLIGSSQSYNTCSGETQHTVSHQTPDTASPAD